MSPSVNMTNDALQNNLRHKLTSFEMALQFNKSKWLFNMKRKEQWKKNWMKFKQCCLECVNGSERRNKLKYFRHFWINRNNSIAMVTGGSRTIKRWNVWTECSDLYKKHR